MDLQSLNAVQKTFSSTHISINYCNTLASMMCQIHTFCTVSETAVRKISHLYTTTTAHFNAHKMKTTKNAHTQHDRNLFLCQSCPQQYQRCQFCQEHSWDQLVNPPSQLLAQCADGHPPEVAALPLSSVKIPLSHSKQAEHYVEMYSY